LELGEDVMSYAVISAGSNGLSIFPISTRWPTAPKIDEKKKILAGKSMG
jgi:hypothetical protein